MRELVALRFIDALEKMAQQSDGTEPKSREALLARLQKLRQQLQFGHEPPQLQEVNE